MKLTAARFIQKPSLDTKAGQPDFKLPPARRWLALVRNNGPFWQTPVYGQKWEDVPLETQCLLWEKRPGVYGVAIPLIDGDWRVTIHGVKGGLHFDLERGITTTLVTPVRAAFIGEGDEPFGLIHEAMRRIAAVLKTFRLREDKPVPAFLDYLGWCTWDAFYHEVSESKVLGGLRSLAKAGINPGFMILDDGWLDTNGDFLKEFSSNPQKFPGGLHGLIGKVKTKFGLSYFGIWHALQGYWAGIDPDGPIAKRFELLHTRGMIRWWEKKEVELHWASPREVGRFYQEFYRWLREQGVDFVKTDGQSALEKFSGTTTGRVSTMARYQEALQGAASTYFAASPIHCMSNGSDVAFHFSFSNVWRNSDDYYPKKPAATQQWHVHMNAVNNIWTRTFAVPDWDMFQTHGPAAEFHAAARALSGGPIYLCDKPGQPHRADLVDQLTTSGGRIIRFAQPALVSRDGVFTDFRAEKRLLKITNHRGSNGEIGLFHCTPIEESITDRFSAGDLPALGGKRCAVWLHRGQIVIQLGLRQTHRVTVAACDYEIATLSPFRHGWACFGLIDKFASSATIEHWEAGTRWASARLVAGGEAAFISPARPRRIFVNGAALRKFLYDRKSGLLRFKIPRGEPATLVLEL